MLQPKLKIVRGSPKNPNFNGRQVWELMEDYTAEIFGVRIIIPKGFQTDLASIPKCLQWFIGTSDENDFRVAALVHDWLYYVHIAWCLESASWIEVSRDFADNCLYELLKRCGVSAWRYTSIWWAVHEFADGHWDNDATDKKYLADLSAQIVETDEDPEDYGLAAVGRFVYECRIIPPDDLPRQLIPVPNERVVLAQPLGK